MKVECTNKECGYEAYARNTDDMMSVVAADGGVVSLPEREIFCPACDCPLEFAKDWRD